ncbi:hypothetical protein AB6A40_007520 [Gnathostoma spinigerum]|uniref:Uncharacterized protein n=1 Tax=Gnathostoma spinigerum TaxID=75299 RepID=A0ABD6EM00_9BILA
MGTYSADPDDSLAVTHSLRNGNFELTGSEDEMSIEPYIRITHNCMQDGLRPNCIVTDDYEVPAEKLNTVYDMGIVSLNIEHKRTVTCS